MTLQRRIERLESLHSAAAPGLSPAERAARIAALGERVASGRATPQQLRRWERVQEILQAARGRMEQQQGGPAWQA